MAKQLIELAPAQLVNHSRRFDCHFSPVHLTAASARHINGYADMASMRVERRYPRRIASKHPNTPLSYPRHRLTVCRRSTAQVLICGDRKKEFGGADGNRF